MARVLAQQIRIPIHSLYLATACGRNPASTVSSYHQIETLNQLDISYAFHMLFLSKHLYSQLRHKPKGIRRSSYKQQLLVSISSVVYRSIIRGEIRGRLQRVMSDESSVRYYWRFWCVRSCCASGKVQDSNEFPETHAQAHGVIRKWRLFFTLVDAHASVVPSVKNLDLHAWCREEA
jgi:hypothetical protein